MSKIIYNANNRDVCVNLLNNCIHLLGDVNNMLYNVNVPYDCTCKNIFNEEKNNFKKTKEILIDYKDNFNKYLEDINKKELEISSMINSLDDIIINKFD